MKKNFIFLLLSFGLILFSCTKSEELLKEVDPEIAEGVRQNTTRISVEDALKNADSFMSLISPKTRANGERKVKSIEAVGLGRVATRSGESMDSLMYVINYDEGFALASGDSRISDPILAISDEGEFNLADTCKIPEMKIISDLINNYLLNSACSNISTRVSTPGVNPNPNGRPNPQPDRNYSKNGKNYVDYSFSYHAATLGRWNQRDPFNKYCIDGNGNTVASGCVPTAISLIMSVHEYPHSFRSYNNTTYTLDWRGIKNYARTNAEAKQNVIYGDQVARLVRENGHHTKVGYWFGESDTFAQDYAIPCFNKMGYECPSPWQNYNFEIVNNSIIKSRPVLIIGTDKSKWVGHAWVLDATYRAIWRDGDEYGYDDFVRCKWGWTNGLCNGFYLSGVFNTIEGAWFLDPTQNTGTAFYNYSYDILILPDVRPIR